VDEPGKAAITCGAVLADAVAPLSFGAAGGETRDSNDAVSGAICAVGDKGAASRGTRDAFGFTCGDSGALVTPAV
jgi:hypothetical protein